MALGSIIVRLTMDTATFDTDAGRAAKIAQKRANEIDASFRKAGKAIGTALGVGIAAVATGLTLATKAAIDNADAIRDLSIRTGVGTETLSEYAYAAQQTGTDIDTVGRGIKILSKNMADALNPTNANAKVFEALGINVKDATGHLKNAADIIPELADKISSMKDGTEKAALMLQLFGKAGLDLTEFMNQGGAGLDAFAEKARSLGIVIDEKTAAAADSFKDKLGDLHAVVGGLGLGIARELLPALESTIDRLIELVQQGNLASDIASVLSAGFGFAAGAMELYDKAVRSATIGMEYWIRAGVAMNEIQKNIQTLGFANGSIAHGAAELRAAGEDYDAARKAIMGGGSTTKAPGINRNRGTETRGTGQFANVNMSGSEVELKKLLDALANNKTGGGKGSKARKAELTDEQKAAKQLADEYTRLTASMQERIGLFGAESELAKTTYDIEQGGLKGLSQAQKDTLIAQAKELDALKEKHDLMEQGKALIESILTPTEQVNKQIAEAGKLLAAGAIAQADYNKAVAGYRTPAQDVIDGLQEEIRLLGMTNEQQDLYNALKYAGADATKAQIEQITGLVHAREQAAAAADLQREVESQLSDAIFDFATGAKSAKDAAIDFFDSIAEYIARMIAENWAKQIAGMFGGQGASASGGASTNWFSMLAGLFGGARANGGGADAGKAYWVGERGPELFMPQSSGTVIPADRSARMVRGGSGPVTNNFYVQGSVDDRTARQMRQEQQVLQRRDTARNN